MSEFDDLLRDSLQRLSEPGDTAGVLEAIKARVEAGNGGPSWPGLPPWAGPLAIAVVALVVFLVLRGAFSSRAD